MESGFSWTPQIFSQRCLIPQLCRLYLVSYYNWQDNEAYKPIKEIIIALIGLYLIKGFLFQS